MSNEQDHQLAIYDAIRIRKWELRKIHKRLGGKYNLWERLKKGGIGSPPLYYIRGNDELDRLQSLASNELQINFELLKKGIFIRIAERTNPYFIPLHLNEILSIELSHDPTKTYLELQTKQGHHLQFWTQLNAFQSWIGFLRGSELAYIRGDA